MLAEQRLRKELLLAVLQVFSDGLMAGHVIPITESFYDYIMYGPTEEPEQEKDSE